MTGWIIIVISADEGLAQPRQVLGEVREEESDGTPSTTATTTAM